MEEFEKVEKLVQKANVSYEDAKKALEEANGDILDAMIALEKAGKVQGPQQSQYTTSEAQQSVYRDVPAAVEKTNDTKGKSIFKDIGAAIKRGFQYTVDNSLKVVRNGQEIIKLPLWISIIALLCAWELLVIVIIVSLFCDCRYSIVGKNDAAEVNNVMNQASDFAGKVKTSFNESFNNAPTAAAPQEPVQSAAETVDGAFEGTVEGPADNTNN
ncbi:MAG: hypothetical protein J6I58_08985 [Eubacterium sp.]|nr:hypothetical protein [Eubacterium sp.]